MTPRLLTAGDRAVLVQTDDLATTLAITARIRQAHLPEMEDLIPASETLLVRVIAGTDISSFGARVLALAIGTHIDDSAVDLGHPLHIPVRYNGPDLEEVARETGLSCAEVIRAHVGTPWRAAFVGFAPGFAYLAGGDPRLRVPRHAESRTSVPAGSVAIAGGFSAVYPRQSPGGWRIIGTTDATLWDIDADPPAAVQPGGWVRFVDIDATATPSTTSRSTSRTATKGAR